MNITAKLPHLIEKDKLILQLPEIDFELRKKKLIKEWKAGKLRISKLSPLEIELIKEYCLTDINWGDYK